MCPMWALDSFLSPHPASLATPPNQLKCTVMPLQQQPPSNVRVGILLKTCKLLGSLSDENCNIFDIKLTPTLGSTHYYSCASRNRDQCLVYFSVSSAWFKHKLQATCMHDEECPRFGFFICGDRKEQSEQHAEGKGL
jgi:hypothetical protein